VGRLARISSYELVDGRRHWSGRLESAAEGVVNVRLEKEGGALARIPFEKIAHGRLEVEFGK
jgi:ribosome maturation factor RimP